MCVRLNSANIDDSREVGWCIKNIMSGIYLEFTVSKIDFPPRWKTFLAYGAWIAKEQY